MQLRHALIPYLYSMAWRNTAQGIPLVTPLYYTHAEDDDAYNCPQAYWFGSELLAAPFTAPTLPDVGLSRQSVWLPPGLWFDFFSGQQYGGGWQTVYGDWDAIPVFARAGAIVPLGPHVGWGGTENPAAVTLHVFPGADSQFVLYEDDGETTAYRQGHYAQTPIAQQWQADRLALSIGPVAGEAALIPASRSYTVIIHGVSEPGSVNVTRNGQVEQAATTYATAQQCLTVQIAAVQPAERVELTIAAASGALLAAEDRRAAQVKRLLAAFRLDSRVKWQIDHDLPQLLTGELSLVQYALTGNQREALQAALERESR
jgi:hypothetical protein